MHNEMAPQPVRNGLGTTALVLGIIGVLLAWIPLIGFFGFILGVLGVIFGIIGIVRAHKNIATNTVSAYVGTSLAAVAVILSSVVFAVFIATVGHVNTEFNTYGMSTGNNGTVHYEVNGSGPTASITHSTNGETSQEIDAPLPWKTEENFDGIGTFSLVAQNSGDGNTTCRITVGNNVVTENTSSGTNSVASCNTTSNA